MTSNQGPTLQKARHLLPPNWAGASRVGPFLLQPNRRRPVRASRPRFARVAGPQPAPDPFRGCRPERAPGPGEEEESGGSGKPTKREERGDHGHPLRHPHR